MDEPTKNSKSALRKCLICGSCTTSARLGLDACRACTVFYRRSRNGKKYACRANTRRCAVDAGGGIACKRCRLDRFERVLKESSEKGMQDVAHSVERNRDIAHAIDPDISGMPRTSLSPFPPVSRSVWTDNILLQRCNRCYRTLNSVRRNGELISRRDALHPLEMSEQECPIYPATFGALNASTKVTLSALLEFADNMFPELSQISREERWNLTVRFYQCFKAVDSCYRANAIFPNDLDKSLIAYTCYFDHKIVDGFFDDCKEMDSKLLDEAKKFMHEILDRTVRPGRQAIARASPNDTEFHAILMLLFWKIDGTQRRDGVVQIGERYRAAVLEELHTHYREVLDLKDYSTRIGELFMLIMHFERTTDIEEHFEICRIMGVFNDDTFVYRLQKDAIAS
ncbi:hypothetical protein PENTCL1PPCAC_4571 [Pristionchus entomophagus]|uniref:Nuclear receptor n=1 Tax=Pristionchus entomophagus TaxID=358040 RepID=A0AAV5SGG0_9BILA|nr:hypothetical protein PENTCL1PPCAC_4571 [Pristionchus entomophagus]